MGGYSIMFVLIGLFGAVCFALGAFFAALILNTEEDNHEQKTRRLHTDTD